MSASDLDLLYTRASEHDPARPSTAVRAAILERARELADHTHERHSAREGAQPRAPERRSPTLAALAELSRRVARWPRIRWQIAAPVAAAALAAIVLQPQLRSRLPAPASRVSAPTRATPAPEPFPAAPGRTQSHASGAPAPRLESPSAAAPRAQLRERSEVERPVEPAAPSELLHEAAARGDVRWVRSILQMYNVPINAPDADGRTALMLAVRNRQEAAVRELLGRGADPNIADADGRTPLEVARDRHELSIFDALLQAGAR